MQKEGLARKNYLFDVYDDRRSSHFALNVVDVFYELFSVLHLFVLRFEI